MHAQRTAVYIDGLNFYYGALRDTPYKWINLEEFCRILLPADRIDPIRYFTAIVNSRSEDPRIPVRQETYLRALKTLPTVSLHRGRFTTRVKTKILADSYEPHHGLFDPYFRPRTIFTLMWRDKVHRRIDGKTRCRVVIEEEKGSDVNLGAHLVNDAARRSIEKALVISNDSDLAEAIRLARSFGVNVGILNPHKTPTSKHLRSVSSFEIPFRRQVLERSLFPDTLRDSSGREIHKPREWKQTQRPGLSTGPWAHRPKQMSGLATR